MANVYLITGCTSDVGTALVRRILKQGDIVIAQGRGDLDKLAPLCAEFPGCIHTYDVDLSSAEQVDIFIKLIGEKHPLPTHIVHYLNSP